MSQCSSCGGPLKYNIEKALVCCEYCESEFDPYSFDDQSGAAKEDRYEANLFTCPQCGGTLLTTDTQAAGFCSFCGATTVMSSRIVKEKRPRFIIPFRKTKKDCVDSYLKRVRKSPYLPKEYRLPGKAEEFRGIYMPFWSCSVKQDGPLRLKGEKSYREGDYDITDHYAMCADVSAKYDGISHDASSSFADNISERIQPFDIKEQKPFSVGFLNGFYADAADVSAEVYQDAAFSFARDCTKAEVQKQPAFSGYSVDYSPIDSFPSSQEDVHATMFPVWFMAYRTGDRVSYATVNGQSGKVVADMPADPGKYLLYSLLSAIPIYFIFSLLLELNAPTMLVVALVCTAMMFVIALVQRGKMKKRSDHEDDLGYLKRRQELENTKKREDTKVPENDQNAGNAGESLFSKESMSGNWPFFLAGIIFVIGVLVRVFNPFQDMIYYVLALLNIVSCFFLVKQTVIFYNLVVTRKLPQFDLKGGDDDAE